MKMGKMSLDSLKKVIGKNRDTILETNAIGSDFSFLEGNGGVIFKIDPMVYYNHMGPEENAFLSFIFSHNDFITSGREPNYAMIDFESPIGLNEEYDRFIEEMFKILRKRNIKLASAHTGSYGNLKEGTAGSISLLGFSKPRFSFKNIREDDSFFLVGRLGLEWMYFTNKLLGMSKGFSKENLSISKIMNILNHLEGKVNYVHDLSEGGLIRGLREISSICKCGFDVETEEIADLVQNEITENYIDPLTVSSSGAVIVSVRNEFKEEFERKVKVKTAEIKRIQRGILVNGLKYRQTKDDVQRIIKKL